jgi:quinol monooxygenase YgiN
MQRILQHRFGNDMNARHLLIGGALVLMGFLYGSTLAEKIQAPFVRIAELEIDPAHLESYKAAVKEEMETAVRVEPGVLAIYAVAEKDHPARLRFFEIYADEDAYKTHLESAHFKKYVATTQPMIRSRNLIDTVPIMLSAKGLEM